jgi:hypothetical protein
MTIATPPAAAQTTRVFRNAGAPTNGTSGTFAAIARKGDLLIDYTNGSLYQNTNTLASPTWTAFANVSPAELTSLLAAIPTTAVTHISASDAATVSATSASAAAGDPPTKAEFDVVVTLVNSLKTQVNTLVTEATALKAAVNATLARLETAGIVTP